MKNSIFLSLVIIITISNVSTNDLDNFILIKNFSDTKAVTIESIITPNTNNFYINNLTFNETDEEILERHLGPRKKGLSFTIIMSLIYILIFICGLFGNICTCCVIITNACMHNTTNYYLVFN